MTKGTVRSFEALAEIKDQLDGADSEESNVVADNAQVNPDDAVAKPEDAVTNVDDAIDTEPVGTGPFIVPDEPEEEEVTGEVEDPGEADETEDKARIVEAIMAYEAYTDPSVLATQSDLLMEMTLPDLEEMLDNIQAEWEAKDGSMVGKTMQERADRGISIANTTAITSPVLKKNVDGLRKAHSEYHKLAAKVEQVLGTETAVKGMGHVEYHNMLEETMVHNHMLMSGIRQCLNAFVSNDLEDRDTLIENVNADTVQANLRTLLTVAISSRQWLERSKKVLGTVMDLQARLQQSEISNKALRETLDHREQAEREERKRQEEARNRGFIGRCVLATRAGMMLGVDEPITEETRIRINNVLMVREMNQVFVFSSPEKAMRTLDKLKEWEDRSEKHRQLLEDGDVYPDLLQPYAITLVKRNG